MREIFRKCRLDDSDNNLKRDITNTIFLILFGVLIGASAKSVDNLSINDEVVWQNLLGIIDLRNILSRLSIWALLGLCISIYSKNPIRASVNVFAFFAGMLLGYYTITITVSGFFPKAYIIVWGIITLFTPLLAFFAWYTKGIGWLSTVFSAITVGFFISQAFSYGIGYFRIMYYPECVFLVIAIVILFRNAKQLLFAFAGALIIAPIFKSLLPYVFGGL